MPPGSGRSWTLPGEIYENQEDHITYFNDFVTHTLDLKHLYTNGHWDQAEHHWLMNTRSGMGDQAFSERLDTAMYLMGRDNILTVFAGKAVPLLVKKTAIMDELMTISDKKNTVDPS